MRYIVKHDFADMEAGIMRKAGDAIKVAPERAAVLAAKGLIGSAMPAGEVEEARLDGETEAAVKPPARKPAAAKKPRASGKKA